MRKQVLGLLLACGAVAAGADDLSWLETYLARPILQPRQTLVETQIHLAARVKPMPGIGEVPAWESYVGELRSQILRQVVFRGEAARWRDLPTKVEWLETLPSNGYRLRKFRYEVIPGTWLPGLLYEPSTLKGRLAVVVNVNGHEGQGVATPYIQERCINLAKKGILAFNYDWFGMGQMSRDGFLHYRLNQIDLTGTSGLAPFFLAQKRLVDIALQHPNADPQRLAVTGLSGGGWQTILLSSLDARVKLAMPVAGYSSFVTRTQFPELDLGDSEQTPVDLGRFADYTHLTAMLAPHPAQLTYNARDNCCFRADYAVAPLLVAARPFFALYGQADRLRYHANFDAGHNYGLDNRLAFYRLLKEYFFADNPEFSAEEIPSAGDVRSAAELRSPLPEANQDFHDIAMRLSAGLPRNAQVPADPVALEAWRADARRRLREITRWPEYRVVTEQSTALGSASVKITATGLSLNGIWTVPVLELAPEGSAGTTIVLADAGKATLADTVARLLQERRRVVAIDPFYFGESRLETRDFLFALLVSALGERPLGIQAGQLAAVARWLKPRYGPVSVESHGPRTSLIALLAGALETDAIEQITLVRPLASLREVIERDLTVLDAPELFCFGLLEHYDMHQLRALSKNR